MFTEGIAAHLIEHNLKTGVQITVLVFQGSNLIKQKYKFYIQT